MLQHRARMGPMIVVDTICHSFKYMHVNMISVWDKWIYSNRISQNLNNVLMHRSVESCKHCLSHPNLTEKLGMTLILKRFDAEHICWCLTLFLLWAFLPQNDKLWSKFLEFSDFAGYKGRLSKYYKAGSCAESKSPMPCFMPPFISLQPTRPPTKVASQSSHGLPCQGDEEPEQGRGQW